MSNTTMQPAGRCAAAADRQAVTPVQAVAVYLERHPALVDAWIGYSEDKRASSGWYIVENSEERFEVGHYPQGDRIYFEDRDRACAEFIVREARSIAGQHGVAGVDRPSSLRPVGC